MAGSLSTLIIVGKRNSKLYQESKRLYSALEKHHLLPAMDGGDKQTLWLKSPNTSLQSTQLINERSLKVDEMILAFLELRLVKPNWEWTVRARPRALVRVGWGTGADGHQPQFPGFGLPSAHAG